MGTKRENPDHSAQLPKLSRVEGQISGIRKMIDERRYCPEIIQQVRATRGALVSIEAALVKAHLEQCMRDAILSGSRRAMTTKISEITQIFKKAAGHGIEL